MGEERERETDTETENLSETLRYFRDPPVEFGEKTRDWTPGHAGKEGPHLEMTVASRGFSRAAAPVWGVS